jgi:membrane fusion protein, multidrug efflux system
MAIENRSVDERDTLTESRPPVTLRQSRAKRWFLLVPLLVLAIGVGGYFGVQWWLYSLHHVYTDDARVKGMLITISSEVAGRLVTRVVEEGQSIKKGDLLAQVQQDEYQAQVALHSAALEAAQSQLASAEADLTLTRTLAEGQIQRSDAILGTSRSQLTEAEKAVKLEEQRTLANLREKEAGVEEARARLTGAKAALDKAIADLDRAKQLAQDGVVAKERLDQAVAAHDSTVAQHQAAQETLNRALALVQMAQAESRRVQLSLDQVQTQQHKVRESQALKELAVAERQRTKMKEDTINNLRAKVKEVEAQLSLARLRLAETTITSPIDGVVSQTIADAGERVQPGQPIVVVNNPRDVWISANIEETYIRKVRDGQSVTITVDAYPHQTFHGNVTQLGTATRSEFALIPAGSASAHFIKVTQRIPVRIAVENPDGLLKPGMMVEVGIRVR